MSNENLTEQVNEEVVEGATKAITSMPVKAIGGALVTLAAGYGIYKLGRLIWKKVKSNKEEDVVEAEVVKEEAIED